MFGKKKGFSVARIDTLIGQGTEINGDLVFTGGLHVDGTINGNVVAEQGSTAMLILSEFGRIEGEVNVPNMVLNGEIVGDVILQPAPDPPGGIEIGWHLAREHWGRGYATEGAVPLLAHAWSLGLEEVIATILPVNLPSMGVAERLGMRRRGPTVERLGLAHGVWVIERPR